MVSAGEWLKLGRGRWEGMENGGELMYIKNMGRVGWEGTSLVVQWHREPGRLQSIAGHKE